MALSIQDISTEYLPIFENLMIEYYDPSLTNAQRKEEIKQIVNAFAQEDNAWCYAIKFICESKSDYTKVYCFGVLHNFILKNWSSLTEQIKNELKDYIWNNLIRFHVEGHHSLFIQNKLSQMCATIVRLSYPTFWASFFQDLTNLISNPATMKLGIRLLDITLEELLIPSDDLFEDRKIELTRLISDQVPLIVNVIACIMRSVSNKCMGSLYVTPPASPIESMAFQAAFHDDEHTISTNNNKQINLKSICLSIKSFLENIDSESLEMLELVLKCNVTLFNWLSINDFYPLLNEAMLELLFVFATFGCSNGHKETSIGVLTLTCINELLSKNYIFNEFSSKFYYTLFEVVFKILLIIDSEIELENLDSEYLNKFLDSIRYFSTNQIVYNPQQENIFFFFNFLEKLFYLTFKPKWNAHYQQLVDIWTNLLDIYINHHPEHYKFEERELDEMESKLFFASNELFKQVLVKSQYRFNAAQLEELNSEDSHDDFGNSELQVFFNYNLELLVKIVQLIPNQTQKLIGDFFDELVKVFLNMDQLLGASFSLDNKRIVTEYLSKEDANNLDYALKDFATLVRVYQRLSEFFYGTNFEASLTTVQTLLERVFNCLAYSNQLQLFTFSCDKEVIVRDLNELHQSLLLFLKFYSCWITQYRSESSITSDQNKVSLMLMLRKICEECVRSIMIVLDQNDRCEDSKRIKMHNEIILQSSLEFKNTLIEKVFKIFTFIVEQPAASFKIILPNMLDVALNQMYHTVVNSNCNDLHSTFFEFLYKFLLNNSKFFFKTPLSHQLSNGGGPHTEQATNQQYFFRIFEIFGNSFIISNIFLYKQNLIALDALNFRQKLFHKQLFKEHLLHHFILLFVQTMVNNKMLHDELTSILYSLASADYGLFKRICLYEFVNKLTNCCPTNFNRQYGQMLNCETIEDAPTFNKQLNQLIAGLRFYKKSNDLLV